MIPLAALAVAACLPVDAARDRITAADLARVLPEWSAVAPETELGYAPVPGVVRVMHPPQLRRMAARYGVVSPAPHEVCFERPTAPIPADRILAAMRRQAPGAEIEILEASRVAAPDGELEFPLSGLRGDYWYGRVTYGGGRHFVVWARVKVSHRVKCVVASADLLPGKPIDAAQLHIETRELPLSAAVGAENAAEFAGRLPRRRIAAGGVVEKQWLDAPRLVERGQVVKVEVVMRGMKLVAEGTAGSSGSLGETIPVENPDSKRRFRARVEGPGRVSVKGSL